jgi:glycosyltransferase involved in cell wall biosynthesis
MACGAEEVIVIDDGSSDDTSAVARALGCRVHRQANQGAAAARRKGIALAKGDFVILLDADDEMIPSGVKEMLLASASLTPGWAALLGVAVGRNDSGESRPMRPPRRVTTWSLLQTGFSPGPPATLIWRRDVLDQVMRNAPTPIWPAYAEDYELLVRGSLEGQICVMPIAVAYYTLSGGKSAQYPARSLACAEVIRRHYSAFLGVPLPRPSRRRLKSRVLLRQLQLSDELQSHRMRKSAKMFQVMVLDPGLFAKLFAEKTAHLSLRKK